MSDGLLTLAVDGLGRPPLALLVDRDDDTRRLYADFLRLAQCDTDEAADGRDALAKALARYPEVIVAETRLPGISGYDLCRLVREDEHIRDTPFVFVTGDAFDADLARARAAGADAVLVKPCPPDDLVAAIARQFQQSRYLRQRVTSLRYQVTGQRQRADAVVGRSLAILARAGLSRERRRAEHGDPPTAPPVLVCPQCNRRLQYVKSYMGAS